MIFVVFIPVEVERPKPRRDDPGPLVPASYVAEALGVSLTTVYAGQSLASGLVPVSKRPWRFVRAEVDKRRDDLLAASVHSSPAQKALKLVNRKRKVA